MSGFTVAKACSATAESADQLANLIAEASGKQVERLKLEGLAGPNHALQLLADIPTWVKFVAVYFCGNVTQGFIGQFGAKAADRLMSRFNISSSPEEVVTNICVEDFEKAVTQTAIENRNIQSFTIGVQMPTVVYRNFGIDLSSLLNGDNEHDRLVLLRSAVAIVEVAKRIKRGNLIASSPQNRDCSVSINLNEDGTFGGLYSFNTQSRLDLNDEQLAEAGYYPPGRYQQLLKFDASGECLEDRLERIANQ